jgi:hypothetical protein
MNPIYTLVPGSLKTLVDEASIFDHLALMFLVLGGQIIPSPAQKWQQQMAQECICLRPPTHL